MVVFDAAAFKHTVVGREESYDAGGRSKSESRLLHGFLMLCFAFFFAICSYFLHQASKKQHTDR